MDDLKDIIKNRLSEAFRGDTQDVSARKLNTTQGNVSKWVNGQQIPTSDMLREISKAYKVSVDWLLGISDQKEIDGVVLEKLTYEQVARIIDRLIELGNITIPDLQELKENVPGEDEYIELYGEDEPPAREPIIDSDYLKVNDRVLSYMLRRRLKIYEIGDDFVEMWKSRSLTNFRGLPLLNYTGNMGEAIDTRSWAAFTSDGDWITLVQELGAMTEEERSALIEKSKMKEKDGENDG